MTQATKSQLTTMSDKVTNREAEGQGSRDEMTKIEKQREILNIGQLDLDYLVACAGGGGRAAVWRWPYAAAYRAPNVGQGLSIWNIADDAVFDHQLPRQRPVYD